jgi:hypothetical protein
MGSQVAQYVKTVSWHLPFTIRETNYQHLLSSEEGWTCCVQPVCFVPDMFIAQASKCDFLSVFSRASKFVKAYTFIVNYFCNCIFLFVYKLNMLRSSVK